MQFRVDLLHRRINVRLNLFLLVDSRVLVAIQEVTGFPFGRLIFFWQTRRLAMRVFELEIIDFGEPTERSRKKDSLREM